MADIGFTLDGTAVVLTDDGCSLLEALRDRLGVRSPKDGCSPQGQCGCCTVWVDGQPRVSCVTPLARVRGRAVTTVDGLPADVAGAWAEALCDTGGSQCGFCTPGIVMRLEALRGPGGASAGAPVDRAKVDQALLAHLCRCTGWQTIHEAAGRVLGDFVDENRTRSSRESLAAAEERAAIEGGTHQRVAPDVALGRGGFADDTAPTDALIAVRGTDGEWMVAETLTAARKRAGKIQGRRTTEGVRWPIDVPAGEWARTLQTTWVEPAYLEPDASWCAPGGEPASTLGNGGAFGGKTASDLGRVARELADRHGRAVRVLAFREDVVRLGPKRPPMAIGLRADGSGVVHVARTPGIADIIRASAPGLEVVEVDVAGPTTSTALRAVGWAEVAVALASLGSADAVRSPSGAEASATIDADGGVHVSVRCGRVLDEVVLRSYCIGAAHMALGWVRSEAITVDAEGVVHDLTMRSFGVLRAVDTPPISVTLVPDDGEPVNGSDAVFAAVAAAAWRAAAYAPRWPVQRSMP